MGKIDTAWFLQQLNDRGESVRGLARYLKLDASAVSRMLKGERKMSAEEQDGVAAFLGLALNDIAAKRRGTDAYASGFAETTQSAYVGRKDLIGPPVADPRKWFSKKDIIYKDGERWRMNSKGELVPVPAIYGCMEGTITIAPGVDLTEPMEFEWSDELEYMLANAK